MRTLLRAAVPAAAIAAVITLGVPADAFALIAAPNPPARRAITTDVVVVGKVTGFAKDMVEAQSPYQGAKDKQQYKIATVKVESGLIGAGDAKEIKVGVFVPPKPKVDPNAPKIGGGIRPPRGPLPGMDIKEGQELVLFLAKHPHADFYIIAGYNPPVDLKDENGKKELEAIKKVAATLADPMKGLKSDKADVRAETAATMVLKYRAYPAFGGEVDQVAINADESKLIMKALTEGDWSQRNFRFDGPPSPLMAFQQLGLTAKEGWVPPVIVNQPGAPPVDFGAVQKDAFLKWLDRSEGVV